MHWKELRPLAEIALFYVLIESLGITCPILFLTGISCAGCGMSRAWLALLCGVGPLVSMHIIIKNTNALCSAYNHRHAI